MLRFQLLSLCLLLGACGGATVPAPETPTSSTGSAVSAPQTVCSDQPESDACLSFATAPGNGIARAKRMAQACNGGSVRVCNALAQALERAPASTPTPERACPPAKAASETPVRSPITAVDDEANEADEAEREAKLGARLLDDPSPERLSAPDHLFRACKLSHAGACNDLGWVYDHGFGTVSADGDKAKELFGKACDLGSSLGCLNRGRVVKKSNTGDAAKFMHRACSAGHSAACEELAGLLADMKASCEKSPVECTNWGYVVERGLGTTPDSNKALAAYQRACNGGSAQGCANAGQFHALGIATKKNVTKALMFFDRACRGKNDFGCLRAKELRAPGD